MFSTQTIIRKSPSQKKTVYFPLNRQISTSPQVFPLRVPSKPHITFNQDLSQSTSLKKIPLNFMRKKSRYEDPLLIHNPPILGMPIPTEFKKFLDGEVNFDQMLKSQVTKNQQNAAKMEQNIKKSKLKRGRTIYLKNQKIPEDGRQSKLDKLQKFIEQKILKKKIQNSNSSHKRSEIIDIIQEQKPINLSNTVKKFKQMQLHYIPKSVEKQENETPSYQRLKFLNESDEYLKKLQEEKQQRLFQKFFIKKGVLNKKQLVKEKNKNQEYFPIEQQKLTPKDAELYNYLRTKNYLDTNVLFLVKQEPSSSKSSRTKLQSRQRQRKPLCQQIFKPQNSSEDNSISVDLSLQSVYEYFLDDLYSEQRKLEQKLSFQQTFNADLEKQLKTVNKIQSINSKVIDCSLNKLFEST